MQLCSHAVAICVSFVCTDEFLFQAWIQLGGPIHACADLQLQDLRLKHSHTSVSS